MNTVTATEAYIKAFTEEAWASYRGLALDRSVVDGDVYYTATLSVAGVSLRGSAEVEVLSGYGPDWPDILRWYPWISVPAWPGYQWSGIEHEGHDLDGVRWSLVYQATEIVAEHVRLEAARARANQAAHACHTGGAA